MALDDTDFDGDETIETTFQRLRQTGHSREEAVQALLDALDVSLSEAKHLLLTHDTWAEARAAAGEADHAGPTNPTQADDSVPPAPG